MAEFTGSAAGAFQINRVALATPGALETVSGGYAYARRLLALTQLRSISLPSGFPEPDPDVLAGTERVLRAWKGPLLIDGLAFGAFPTELAQQFGPRSVVLLHHPLDLEGDVAPAEAARRAEREKRALAAARGVIATSRVTAADLQARFDVPDARLAVAEPGVEPEARAEGSGGGPVRLLCVGAVIPRKGHDLLVEALAHMPQTPAYRLDIAGPTGRAPEYEQALRARIAETGLADRIVLRGMLDDGALRDAYHRADLVVMPSRHEGYGMAATEAIARGLPLIAGAGGALAETAAAGVVVDPQNRAAFAEALRRLIADSSARREAADRAWAVAAGLPRWERTAALVEQALARFLADRREAEDGI